MKPLLALLAIALLGAGASACGSTSTETHSASHASSSATATSPGTATSASSTASITEYTSVDADKDNDVSAPTDDTNNNELNSGRVPSESDRQAITTLLQQYYATALAGNAAKACSMLLSVMAESVVEDYGVTPGGPPYMHGATCPAVLTGLFKHFHTLLALQVPMLKVTRIRLVGHRGQALLNFGAKLPEREIPIAREGPTWRMAAMLDRELP